MPPDTAVPTLAVVCLCVITAVFTGLSFGGLAVIQCLLYGFALLLEFLSLIILRVRLTWAQAGGIATQNAVARRGYR